MAAAFQVRDIARWPAAASSTLSFVRLAPVLPALVRTLLCLGVDAGPAHLRIPADGLGLCLSLRHSIANFPTLECRLILRGMAYFLDRPIARCAVRKEVNNSWPFTWLSGFVYICRSRKWVSVHLYRMVQYRQLQTLVGFGDVVTIDSERPIRMPKFNAFKFKGFNTI